MYQPQFKSAIAHIQVSVLCIRDQRNSAIITEGKSPHNYCTIPKVCRVAQTSNLCNNVYFCNFVWLLLIKILRLKFCQCIQVAKQCLVMYKQHKFPVIDNQHNTSQLSPQDFVLCFNNLPCQVGMKLQVKTALLIDVDYYLFKQVEIGLYECWGTGPDIAKVVKWTEKTMFTLKFPIGNVYKSVSNGQMTAYAPPLMMF